MARSVLADAPFVQTKLSFPTADSWGEDEHGQPIPIPGKPVILDALVSPDKQKQLQLQPGADAQLIPVKCELVSPLVFPPGVGLGTRLDLEWAGRASKLLITSVTPNDLVGVDFGTFFLGEVTPSG